MTIEPPFCSLGKGNYNQYNNDKRSDNARKCFDTDFFTEGQTVGSNQLPKEGHTQPSNKTSWCS